MIDIQNFGIAVGKFIFDKVNVLKIKNYEINAGSFWINMENGDTYYIMVDKCEKEEET